MSYPGTLPTDFYQTGNIPEDIDRLYKLMRDSTNSIIYGDSVIQTLGATDVKIIGFTLGGVGTYDYQVGRLIRYGQHVHFWFSMKWTAFSIPGPGNYLSVQLPFPSIDMGDWLPGYQGPGFVGNVYAEPFNWTGLGCYLSLASNRNNHNIALVMNCIDGTTSSLLSVPNAGSLAGYISYITS